MNRRTFRIERVASVVARLLAVLILALTLLPGHVARAQQEDAAADVAELPLSVIEQLAAAPGLAPAPVPAGVVLPADITAEELAQMPDRTQFAVIDYEVIGSAVNARVQLPATQATFISSGFPGTNYANDSFINLGWDQSGRNAMRMLVQFDLSRLPANAQIDSASFFLHQSRITPANDGTPMAFRAQFMQQSWNASSVTWNNANFLGGAALPLGNIPPALGWISGNATGVVRAWDSGEPNRGLLVTGDEIPGNGRWRQFWSRQTPGLAPYLEVNFTVNCDTAAPTARVEPLSPFSPSEFRVNWSATDPNQPGCPASGVAWWNVRYRINGGSWVNWRNRTDSPTFTFRGWAPNNAFVDFQAQAADNAGNLGAWSPTVSTRIDDEPPVAAVNPLPQFTIFPSFTVTWFGTDNLSGVASYNLQMSRNDGDWLDLLTESPATSFQVTGAQFGEKLKFRVQAIDNVGNAQAWSPNAQASTTVVNHPIAVVQPFNPPIIQSTAPVTNVIPVRWSGFFAPGTTIVSYELRFRHTPFGGATGPWRTWNPSFPGATTAADFDYAALGLGDGIYEFFAMATNNVQQSQPFDPASGTGASVILDLNDRYQPALYFPLIFNQTRD